MPSRKNIRRPTALFCVRLGVLRGTAAQPLKRPAECRPQFCLTRTSGLPGRPRTILLRREWRASSSTFLRSPGCPGYASRRIYADLAAFPEERKHEYLWRTAACVRSSDLRRFDAHELGDQARSVKDNTTRHECSTYAAEFAIIGSSRQVALLAGLLLPLSQKKRWESE